MHKQDPEKVQWESRCHFSHVVLMGAWRVNILITSFPSNSPVLVLLGHLDGEVGNQLVWCSHWLLTWSPFKVLFTGTTHHHHKLLIWNDTKKWALLSWLQLWMLWWTSYPVITDRADITAVEAIKQALSTQCVLQLVFSGKNKPNLLYFQLEVQQFNGCDSLYY